MNKSAILTCAAVIAACCGCVVERRSLAVDDAVSKGGNASYVTHMQVAVQTLDEVANTGLLLPAVSPDGKHVAFVQYGGGRADPNTLFDGRGAEQFSLYIQPITSRGAKARLICPAGALWPTWSGDGSRLAFVVYDKSGRCDLAVYELATGNVRRLGGGLKRMSTPALSYDGRRVAVVSASSGSVGDRLYVIDLETSKIIACPIDSPQASQLQPQWTPDGRVVYLLAEGGRTWVAQWGPEKFAPEIIREIDLPAGPMGLFQAFAGLAGPLSPDGRQLAYYDPAGDNIVIVDLQDDKQQKLPAGTRAGCWLGPRRFIAAGGKQMRLFTVPPSPSVLIMRGRWLPRRGVASADEIVLCTSGSYRAALRLVRMKLLSKH